MIGVGGSDGFVFFSIYCVATHDGSGFVGGHDGRDSDITIDAAVRNRRSASLLPLLHVVVRETGGTRCTTVVLYRDSSEDSLVPS